MDADTAAGTSEPTKAKRRLKMTDVEKEVKKETSQASSQDKCDPFVTTVLHQTVFDVPGVGQRFAIDLNSEFKDNVNWVVQKSVFNDDGVDNAIVFVKQSISLDEHGAKDQQWLLMDQMLLVQPVSYLDDAELLVPLLDSARVHYDKNEGMRLTLVIMNDKNEDTSKHRSTLINLQLQHRINNRVVHNTAQLASLVRGFHRAVAVAAYKQRCGPGGQSKSTKVPDFNKDSPAGNDAIAKQWWTRMLEEMPNLGENHANAVTSAYPNMKQLREILLACETDDQRWAMLRDIDVTHGEGRTLTTRRLGDAAAKRIVNMLTTNEPNCMLT